MTSKRVRFAKPLITQVVFHELNDDEYEELMKYKNIYNNIDYKNSTGYMIIQQRMKEIEQRELNYYKDVARKMERDYYYSKYRVNECSNLDIFCQIL